MNSPNTSLAWHFPSATSAPPNEQQQQQQSRRPRPQQASGLPGLLSMASGSDFAPQTSPPQNLGTASTAYPQSSQTTYQANGGAVGNVGSSNDLLVDLNSPYRTTSHQGDNSNDPFALHSTTSHNSLNGTHSHQHDFSNTSVDPSQSNNTASHDFSNWNYSSFWDADNPSIQPFGDMMIESQDVDMSMLGLEMMPWFEPSQDFSGWGFDTGGQPSPADGSGANATTGGAQQSSPRG